MSKELKKRIITSIILFIAAISCILINHAVFLFMLFLVLYICFDEWGAINFKYFNGGIKKQKFSQKYFYIKIFGLAYLFFVFISAMTLRANSVEGGIFFIIILCTCICSDTGGYIFGKTIGGKKLIKISPSKTVSGSAGSFIFS